MDLDIHPGRPTANLHDILIDPTIPEWKKDLIVRKRNTNRLLFGNLKLTCASLSISNHNTPTADAIRNDDIEAAAAATTADANLTEEAEPALLVDCHTSADDAASGRISSPEPEYEEEEDSDEEVQGEEEEDFHLQEDSPQVNGESEGVGHAPGEDDDAVDSLSISAPESVSPECRTWCEGAMRLNNDPDSCFTAANKIVLNGAKRAVSSSNKVKRSVLATNNKIMGEEKPKMKSSARKLSAPPLGTKTVVHTVNLGDPEEIKYGPGIVHKLRDRYINITLRESASAYKQRPSLNNLRRASSLDNILDEAPVVRRPPQPEKKQPVAKSKEPLSAAEHMKRHRSMETLLFEKQAPLVNEDIVIIEHSQPPAPVVSRKRNSSGGGAPSEDEMPPPDVVKQTRQKFERRTNTMPQPKHGIVATRVASYKKPALSPKPAHLDALRKNKDVGTLPPPLPLPMSSPEISKLLSPVEKKQPPVIVSEEPKVVETPAPPSPLPRVTVPSETPPPQVPVPKESPPPRVPIPKESPPSRVPVPRESPPSRLPVPKESPPPPRVPSPKESSPAKIDDDDETSKIISKKALENIRKNGFSFVISPKGSPNLSHLPGGEKGTPPQVISVHQKGQDKQVGVIRPIPKVVTEKNLINAVKSEQPLIKTVTLRQVKVEATPPVAPVVVAKPEPAAELWGSNKRHFNEQPSTQLFDFTTRKSVPDYIENDGLGQRPAPVGEEVDGGGGGNLLALEISFEIVGGNVLINGRSSLQKQPKANKMKIKFDDGATSTFEYPSEASLLLDDVPLAHEDSPLQPRGMQALPSGSGSLASYTPSKILMSEDTFELGVTRAAAMTPVLLTSQPQEDSFLLKPAEEEDTVAWSSETASSDLLF